MGDVQGKCQDDSEGKIEKTLDPRDLLGPPDRVAIGRSAFHLQQVLPNSPTSACLPEEPSKRKKSVYARDSPKSILRTPQGDYSTSPTSAKSKISISMGGPSLIVSTPQGRRKTSVTQPQPLSAEVKERSKSQPILSRFPSSQPKQQRLEKKIPPLAEAITKGNPSEKNLLVFEDLERVRTRIGSSGDRSSPESNSSPTMTLSSKQSGSTSSSSDADSLEPSLEFGRWRRRWCIDRVGREPGQIRCVRDLCMLRRGCIVATEPKNSRLQMFSKSGESLAVLGPDMDDLRSSRSFGSPANFRKMQPTGVVETVVDSLVAVLDLNRVLYVEAIPGGMMKQEVLLRGKTDLRGIASTRTSKLIITEVGSQPSVGLYETSGKFIREFRGNFRKPCYVTYDPTYDVSAVSDNEQRLVCLYDSSGNPLTKFGASRNASGNPSSAAHLVYPSGVCWASAGRLLVADEVQKKVVVFDLRNLTAEVLLTADDGLNQPVAIAADFRNSRNRIYVAEELYDFGVNMYYLKMFEQRLTNSF